MQKNYNVTFSINKGHLLFCYVTLYSLLKNNPNYYFNIYIAHYDCISYEEIQNFCNKNPLNIFNNYKIHLVDVSSIETLKLKTFIPSNNGYFWLKEVLFKLFLPQMLQNVDTILHLDTDVIIRKDISNLFEVDNKYLFTGAKSGNDSWVNAGVLLINLKLYRELNALEKIIPLLSTKNVTEEHIIQTLFKDKVSFYKKDIAINYPFIKNIKTINNSISVHFLYPKPFSLDRGFSNKTFYKEYYSYLFKFIDKKNKIKFMFLVLLFKYFFSHYYSLKRRILWKKNKIFKKPRIEAKTDINFYMTRKIIEYSIIK